MNVDGTCCAHGGGWGLYESALHCLQHVLDGQMDSVYHERQHSKHFLAAVSASIVPAQVLHRVAVVKHTVPPPQSQPHMPPTNLAVKITRSLLSNKLHAGNVYIVEKGFISTTGAGPNNARTIFTKTDGELGLAAIHSCPAMQAMATSGHKPYAASTSLRSTSGQPALPYASSCEAKLLTSLHLLLPMLPIRHYQGQ